MFEIVSAMNSTVAWARVADSESLAGLWVAMDNCRYDQTTHQPIEGDVVDSDEDLAELCGRLRETGRSSCVICFCDREPLVESRAVPGASPMPRAILARQS